MMIYCIYNIAKDWNPRLIDIKKSQIANAMFMIFFMTWRLKRHTADGKTSADNF